MLTMCMPTQSAPSKSLHQERLATRKHLLFQQQQQEDPQFVLVTSGHKRGQMTHQHQHQREQRQVHFSQEEAAVENEDPHDPISQEEARTIWYQRDEMIAFKRTARNFLLGITNRHSEETRGFEGFQNLDRAHSKLLSVKCILLAQKKGMKQDQLAAIAQRCSETAVAHAICVGCQDYCGAYQPHMTPFLSSTVVQNNSNDSEKRGLFEQQQQQQHNPIRATMPPSKRIRTC
jgi:hypothetical protein